MNFTYIIPKEISDEMKQEDTLNNLKDHIAFHLMEINKKNNLFNIHQSLIKREKNMFK